MFEGFMFFAEIPFMVWLVIFVIGAAISLVVAMNGKNGDENGYLQLQWGGYCLFMGAFIYDTAQFAMDNLKSSYWDDTESIELNVTLNRFLGLLLIVWGITALFIAIYQKVSPNGNKVVDGNDKSKTETVTQKVDTEMAEFIVYLKMQQTAALDIMLNDSDNYSEEEIEAIKKELSSRE